MRDGGGRRTEKTHTQESFCGSPRGRMSPRSELRHSVGVLSSRCLTNTARWCAELLSSCDDDPDHGEEDAASNGAARSTTTIATTGTADEDRSPCEDGEGGRERVEAEDRVNLARIYIDSREYLRCVHLLRDTHTVRGNFLRWYARYLAGEKRREELHLEGEDKPVNEELRPLRSELSECRARGELDAFGLYLHGLVLKALAQKREAILVLSEAVRQFPLHWGAWLELASMLTEREECQDLDLPDHWMRRFFQAHVALEFQENEKATEIYASLEDLFPTSAYIRSQQALALYNARDFDDAQKVFQEIMADDPYRLEGIDTFSNLLYVKEQRAELSILARKCVQIDKYRPETCCVIGNYLSLRQQHEKAVHYFHRALQLNRTYLSAWTLMGHEYVEMKNTSAAVEAYRNAVDINPRDYRAWYGLGQTYELLNMPLYTLYYFRKAAALRPRDARMWCAMGHCYEELHRHEEAVACYERAFHCDDREGVAVKRLAVLYRRLGLTEEAADMYTRVVEQEEELGEASTELVEALLYLAEHELSNGREEVAEDFCNRLLDSYGPGRVRASILLQKIRREPPD